MMPEVNIYIDTSIKGPSKRKGAYIYILEYRTGDGKIVTRDGRGILDQATENELALTAITDALKRLNKSCSVRVFTRCDHILNAMKNHWARQWQKKGWVNAKGKKVRNADLWEKVLTELDKHICLFTDQEHSYGSWMESELKKEVEKWR